jgi:NAD(P)H-nitrite reductase large subunit
MHPTLTEFQHLVIVGNGIAGITAARHVRARSGCRITVVSSENPHFFSRTALMYAYMGHLEYHHLKPYEDDFWGKNEINLLHAHVTRLDTASRRVHYHPEFSTKTQQIDTTGPELPLDYDVLLLATGSRYNRFGWPGQDLDGAQGLYGLPDLREMERATMRDGRPIERAVVVGGGLIGVEMAEMLRSRGIGVTFLVREAGFWGNVLPPEEAQLVGRHVGEHHVDLRLSTELDRILDDGTGRVGGVVTHSGDEIRCQFVGLTVGVSPNADLAKTAGIETDRGILVDEFLQTSHPDVYAVGDCTQLRRPGPGQKAVNPIWYTGRIMGETVARTLTGKPTAYQPGPFFNSAKFFDIEYQTYGLVPARLPDDQESFYWESPDGRKALRLNFDRRTRALVGVNAFGIRLRHAVFDRWLRDPTSVEHVIEHLPEANFDPEFFRKNETAIAAAFNARFGTTLRVKARKGLFSTIFS